MHKTKISIKEHLAIDAISMLIDLIKVFNPEIEDEDFEAISFGNDVMKLLAGEITEKEIAFLNHKIGG